MDIVIEYGIFWHFFVIICGQQPPFRYEMKKKNIFFFIKHVGIRTRLLMLQTPLLYLQKPKAILSLY